MGVLFTVTDRFEITGRGVVLLPGIPSERRLPSELRIVRPDGSDVRARAGVEFVSGFRTIEAATRWSQGPRAICAFGIAAADVPVGSVVHDG